MNKCLIVVRNIKVKCTFDRSAHLDNVALDRAKKLVSRSPARKCVDTGSAFVYKKSVDARNREDIILIYSVAFASETFPEQSKLYDVVLIEDVEGALSCTKKNINPPVVAGFGPAGMFCALALAKAGLNPIVIERGGDVDVRTQKVNEYWTEGRLDEQTNVQFGEGGAGTFSDGKLLTRISDSLCSYVLAQFVKFGAPKEITYLAKPHIGTDNLRKIVKNIRNEIIKLGGQVLFLTRLDDIKTDSFGNVKSIVLSDGNEIATDCLFLCTGHSARDTILNLRKSMSVMPKPFSVGVRIEHLQEDIDNALYGAFKGAESLGAASYTLSRRYDKRAVYSFCMCPGGTVVASASEDGQIVTNGMSNYARDGLQANSAIAVSVDLEDFGSSLEGAIEFQHAIERRAFEAAGGDGGAPIQTLGDFLNNTRGTEPTRVMPTYTGKTVLSSADEVFPQFVCDNLRLGIAGFEREIEGFSQSDSLLTFPETRTSSPFKIPRDKSYLAIGFNNLYPCGEGAGYAGGITSAAVDGLRAAISYIKS